MTDYRSRKSLLARATASLLCANLLSSCVMGPNYHRPEIAQPNDFRFQINQTDASSFADLAWWEVFKDPALQTLITAALKNSTDLQVAAARIEQARQLVGVARSQGLPQLNYDAHGGAQKKPGDDQDIVGSYSSGVGLLNAAWELDIWGRIRRATEAARANTYQQEEIRRGIMLTLVSDVANGYFRLLQLDRELAIATESQSTFTKTHELFSLRFQAGRDSRLPVERAKASLDESTAQVASIKREIAQQENALSILAGAYPGPIPRGMTLTAQQMPPQTPVGLSTDLLRRRPDIRAAEQGMISANAADRRRRLPTSIRASAYQRLPDLLGSRELAPSMEIPASGGAGSTSRAQSSPAGGFNPNIGTERPTGTKQLPSTVKRSWSRFGKHPMHSSPNRGSQKNGRRWKPRSPRAVSRSIWHFNASTGAARVISR